MLLHCLGTLLLLPTRPLRFLAVILDYLASKRISTGDLVVVSPDVGGVARARAFAKKLNDAPLAIVDKRRSAHNVSEVMNLIGDVRGKVAVLVDDMIDTAGTITNAAKVLHAEGAREVYACATHAVFSPPAVERLSRWDCWRRCLHSVAWQGTAGQGCACLDIWQGRRELGTVTLTWRV